VQPVEGTEHGQREEPESLDREDPVGGPPAGVSREVQPALQALMVAIHHGLIQYDATASGPEPRRNGPDGKRAVGAFRPAAARPAASRAGAA
jgi:hypothetical protein